MNTSKVYGVVHSREIAVVVSHQVLAGKFHHLSVGPTINFTGSGSFVIQDDGQGVSWADFTMFRIFSETSRQVIGEISIPGALQNPRTLPVEENRSKTVLPPKPVAPKDVKKTEQNNAGGYTLMSMGTFSLVILSVSFAVSIIN